MGHFQQMIHSLKESDSILMEEPRYEGTQIIHSNDASRMHTMRKLDKSYSDVGEILESKQGVESYCQKEEIIEFERISSRSTILVEESCRSKIHTSDMDSIHMEEASQGKTR